MTEADIKERITLKSVLSNIFRTSRELVLA